MGTLQNVLLFLVAVIFLIGLYQVMSALKNLIGLLVMYIRGERRSAEKVAPATPSAEQMEQFEDLFEQILLNKEK